MVRESSPQESGFANGCKLDETGPQKQKGTFRERRLANRKEADHLWGKTGFFRPLGGFWFNYIFNLAMMIFALVFLGVIFPNYILPYPEALGFKSVVSSLFAMLFTLFDVGIGSSVTRYMAEYVGRGEIKKSLEYLRFFIWFQMFTGLIQITIIAYYSLAIAKYMTNLAPLVWLFLINSTIQYPGMLGVYNGALQAFQRYDKKNIVSFLQGVVFEMTTQVIFIFIGRAIGRQNPMFGELMGATMGYVIGLYIDDFFAMLLSAYFFKQLLKPYGLSLKETLVPQASRDVIKNSLIFGTKNMAQGLFYQFSMLFITAITIWWMPAYATIIGLFSIADGLVRIVIQDLPMTASVSEAYNCGKKNLTDYYIQAQFKWYGILTPYLSLEVLMLIPPIVSVIAGNYAAAAWMIPYLLVSRFFIGPIHFSDSVQQGCDKPEYAAYSLAVQMVARVISFFFLLSPWGLPAYFETYNFAVAYLLADFPSIIAKNIFAWWLIDRKLIKVRINWWQTVVTPFIVLIPLIPVNLLLVQLFNVAAAQGMIYAILLGVFYLFILLFIAPIILLFPLLGLMGGWDERGLEHLREAALISGPSRGLVLALYKGAKWGLQHSPFRKIAEQFRIPHEAADQEADELYSARLAAMTSQQVN
jgi:O-antigen/teichoic acid export membrane protein